MKLFTKSVGINPDPMGRDFVIGDLHGMYNRLIEKLNMVLFDGSRDRLFCVGDLIDRGPDSMRCLELLEKPWFYSVMGNHESMMINAIKYKERYSDVMWLRNGGQWSVNHLEELESMIDSVESSLPVAMEVQTNDGLIGIVHADYHSPIWDLKELEIGLNGSRWDFHANHLLWSRGRVMAAKQGELNIGYEWVEGVKAIYCGHTPLHEPIREWNFNFIDCGAFLRHTHKKTDADLWIEQIN